MRCSFKVQRLGLNPRSLQADSLCPELTEHLIGSAHLFQMRSPDNQWSHDVQFFFSTSFSCDGLLIIIYIISIFSTITCSVDAQINIYSDKP